jgi:hypothetical protein
MTGKILRMRRIWKSKVSKPRRSLANTHLLKSWRPRGRNSRPVEMRVQSRELLGMTIHIR